ncbi:small ubiquitin-related modifier protein [Aureococcus anophagefferens]|uniref:Small ubiquitin-related modifier protein n=1 Tax=Aureococcus anophagefferens TaxID=44056 RepID=A0ABR1FVP1_AURAN
MSAKAARVRVKTEAEPAPKRTKVKPSSGSLLNIRIRHWSGEVTFFGVKKTTQLDKVFNAYSQRKGINVMTLRFLFDGQRVLSGQTPQDIDMEDGDQLDCTLEQVGDIGTFGDHAGSPGLACLQPGAKLDDAPAAVVREIAVRCRRGGSEGAAPYFASFPAAGLLSAAQRAALRSELDLGARGALDYKKPLTRREASSRLGAKVYGSLEALFSSHGGRVDEIVLRRSAAVGQCINFHTDVNHKTFQLCLNDDFDGGDLVFAADDKLAAK